MNQNLEKIRKKVKILVENLRVKSQMKKMMIKKMLILYQKLENSKMKEI